MDFFSNNDILFFNILMWISFLVFYKNKNGRFTLGYVIILLYVGVSFASAYAFNSEYAPLDFKKDLSIFSFLFLFLMIFISLIPIISLKEKKIKYLCIPESKWNDYFCLIMGIFSLLAILQSFSSVMDGLSILFSGSDSLVDLYQDSKEERMSRENFSGSINIIGIFSNIARQIGPLLLYGYLLQKKRKTIVLFALACICIQGVVSGIATANRATITSSLFPIVMLYFFFKPFIDKPLLLKIKKVFFVFFGLVVLIMAVITLARFGSTSSRYSLDYSIAKYIGEGPIVFDNYCVTSNMTREGYFVSPLLNVLAGKKSLSENEKRFKFGKMEVVNSRFYTFVGDYVLDYGVIVSFFIFIFVSLFAFFYLKHKDGLTYDQLIILYIIFRFCSSFYQASFTNISGNLSLLFLLFYSAIFYYRIVGTVKIYKKTN